MELRFRPGPDSRTPHPALENIGVRKDLHSCRKIHVNLLGLKTTEVTDADIPQELLLYAGPPGGFLA